MNEILQVRGLRKTFRLSAKQQKIERTKEKVKVAVDDLSFSARRGEIFGLLGPNGAGKTTTLRMLATLIRPDAGDALVDGASIVTEPERVREPVSRPPELSGPPPLSRREPPAGVRVSRPRVRAWAGEPEPPWAWARGRSCRGTSAAESRP